MNEIVFPNKRNVSQSRREFTVASLSSHRTFLWEMNKGKIVEKASFAIVNIEKRLLVLVADYA